jgi:hypothetical protein
MCFVVGMDSVSGSTKIVTSLWPDGSSNLWQFCESDPGNGQDSTIPEGNY